MRAFELAASNEAAAVPADWFDDTVPEKWRLQNVSQPTPSSGETRFQWCGPDGAYPFKV